MAKKKTITGELEPMKIGESKEFPASLCTTARSMASMLGFKWNRVYKTETDRERPCIPNRFHSFHRLSKSQKTISTWSVLYAQDNPAAALCRKSFPFL